MIPGASHTNQSNNNAPISIRPTSRDQASNNLLGIVAMALAMMVLVLNDAFVKLASEELPTGEIIALRGAVMSLAAYFVARATGALRPLSSLRSADFSLRLLGECGAAFFYIQALIHMPLSSVNAIIMVAPLVVTAASALLLKSTVGWRRWAATTVGLIGIMLIVRPGTDAFSWHAVMALIAVGFVALRDITTSRIDMKIPSLFIALATAVAVSLTGLALLPFEDWIIPPPGALALLISAAALLLGAYMLMIAATRRGELAVIVPVRYFKVPCAVILGALIWGHVPDPVSLAGFAIIIAAGLYTLQRERLAARRAS